MRTRARQWERKSERATHHVPPRHRVSQGVSAPAAAAGVGQCTCAHAANDGKVKRRHSSSARAHRHPREDGGGQ
eukprot:13019066-Alexandrium_andersonii.AAC.1